MKNLIPVTILLALAVSGCSGKRDTIVSEQKERVADTIRIGDVKVMAHPLAGANVDRGVEVEVRWKHGKQRG